MITRIDDIRLIPGESEDELLKIAENRLGTKPGYFRILKKSLDARREDIYWVYSIEFSGDLPPAKPKPDNIKTDERIIIVGSGPAGLFAAVHFVDRGVKPLIIERGKCVDERQDDIDVFFDRGILNENSNVQFGEGGAGTFSDGKLFTQTHRGYTKDVLDTFVRFGAPDEVGYLSKPHVGSDKLKIVIKNMRNYITEHGGVFRFNTVFERIIADNGRLKAVQLRDLKTDTVYEESADRLLLAIGHSARDTFKNIIDNGVAAERKDFAVGVRIEHIQERISRAQYGEKYRILPPADYKLVSHASGKAVFTFCNCPGGYVIAASSESGGICTNGMSNYSRDGVNCNSALLVNILESDLDSDELMAGVDFQRKIERMAFNASGKNYRAPCESVGSLLRLTSRSVSVSPTYPLGTVTVPLREYLPEKVVEALKISISDFGKKIHGFDSSGALLTGPETRFSSPLKFTRNETCESISVKGVYPCGEGSGYSGGITSSAADGLRAAENILLLIKKNS